MSYFEDLSAYNYLWSGCRSGTRNIGWLDPAHDFPRQVPTQEVLDCLWEHSTISVVQTRGLQYCEFCEAPPRTVYAKRDGVRLHLGSAEIRVLSKDGNLYAAPTLLLHYVRTHQYKPPDEFLHALTGVPNPPDPDYFEALTKIGLKWGRTLSGNFPPQGFRFEKISGQVQRVKIEIPTFVDEM